MIYKEYRRTQIAELADWTPDFDMHNVSISGADRSNGSPKLGDKVARNPANHNDRWLVAKDYFYANFEAVASPAMSFVEWYATSNFHPRSTPIPIKEVTGIAEAYARHVTTALTAEVARLTRELEQGGQEGKKP